MVVRFREDDLLHHPEEICRRYKYSEKSRQHHDPQCKIAPNEYHEFGYKPGKSRQAKCSKASDNQDPSYSRCPNRQTRELVDIPSAVGMMNHSSKGEHQRGYQAVRNHL